MKDLETLQSEVLDPRTKPLVGESIKAYSAGARRAATVSLWIAVVADLTYKLRHLAERGDGIAEATIRKLDEALIARNVRGVQEYERDLLNVAGEKLQILSAREVIELERLNEDRNLCAHPGFVSESELFLPDAEAVRAHLAAACRGLFSQRPLAGKHLVTMLADELKGDSWPGPDRETLKTYLLDRYFRSSRLTVQDNLLKVLIKGGSKLGEGGSLYAQRCRDAANVLADEHPLTLSAF